MTSLVVSAVILLIIVLITATSKRARENRDRALALKLQSLSINDPALQSVVRGLSEGEGATIRAIKEYREISRCGLYEARFAINLLRAKLRQP